MTYVYGLLFGAPLLAEGPSRVVSFSEPIRRGSAAEMDWGSLATVVLVLVAALLVATWTTRAVQAWRKRWHDSPTRLFLDLCRAHQLNRHERRLLLRMARLQRLPRSADLFLAPQCFDVEQLTPALTRQAAQLQVLRTRLFGPPATPR